MDTTPDTTPARSSVRHAQRDKLYILLAGHIAARQNCIRVQNTEWEARHTQAIEQMAKDLLPSGSGVDNATTVDLERSHGDKLVLDTAFHHMDEGGGYDGWTEHTIVVVPSFCGGLSIDIKGRNRNGIKDYLGDLFHTALTENIEESWSEDTAEYAYRSVRWIED